MRKKLLMPEIEKEAVTTSMANSQQTCVSIREEKEEKKENMSIMVKDTMVKEGEGGSVTTLLLAGNDEKNGNKTGN